MGKLSLAYYGDPILRMRAPLVQEITPEIRLLGEEMIEMMFQHDGLGLAAPQVKHLVRLFVMRIPDYDDNYRPHYREPQIVINPVLSAPSDEYLLDSEGCLSLPGMRGDVLRPAAITLEAVDIHGKPFRMELEGYNARMVMHETDHLNGKLYIDRMRGQPRQALEPKLRQLQARYAKEQRR
ncbi:MAG: peptide deformylase [Chlamydiia bacterium]